MNKSYDDIINTSWPEASSRKQRMDAAQRAKIFLPFSALTGYYESLDKTREKSEAEIEQLNIGHPIDDWN